jgi:hypothetical protein
MSAIPGVKNCGLERIIASIINGISRFLDLADV